MAVPRSLLESLWWCGPKLASASRPQCHRANSGTCSSPVPTQLCVSQSNTGLRESFSHCSNGLSNSKGEHTADMLYFPSSLRNEVWANPNYGQTRSVMCWTLNTVLSYQIQTAPSICKTHLFLLLNCYMTGHAVAWSPWAQAKVSHCMQILTYGEKHVLQNAVTVREKC